MVAAFFAPACAGCWTWNEAEAGLLKEWTDAGVGFTWTVRPTGGAEVVPATGAEA